MAAKKSTELRERLGDPSKGAEPTKAKRVKSPEVYGVKGICKTPPDTMDPVGRVMWLKIVRNADWLVASDEPALALLCRMHCQAQRIMDKDSISPSDVGFLKTYMEMLTRFGLDPSSRINLGLAVAETQSKLDAFRKDR